MERFLPSAERAGGPTFPDIVLVVHRGGRVKIASGSVDVLAAADGVK